MNSLTPQALRRNSVVSSFTAPRSFIEAVRELAETEGRTVSELIREALTEKHNLSGRQHEETLT